MKKCGILTINVGLMNYGNRLQNYALQEYLKSLKCDVRTINYKPTYPTDYGNNSSWIEKIKRNFNYKKIYQLTQKYIFYLKNRRKIRRKKEKFTEFVQTKIQWTDEQYEIDSDFSELARLFDYIVCGSDQVWNPYWEGTNPIYFMEFMPSERRITYAVSFGVDNIPDEMISYYTQKLNGIQYIACRENKGVEIVKKVSGKKVIQVLDPVFLLDVNDWNKIMEKPRYFKEDKPYILAYFLGRISKLYKKKIVEYKNQLNCNIYYLDKEDMTHSVFASPSEFLYLVKNAKLVCTDSFHGLAFSILFKVPFVCFLRSNENGVVQDMSSRMKSLFKVFECENRYADILNDDALLTVDFERIEKILQREKYNSQNYLKGVLDIS